ncbi:MAG TPA: beta-ketoacyl-[acyl-carrier-protein] synthase family protein [Micropepsaceae bacterium]|nr:beta-ketoacyl-[acyl-carrier-protein] synthase family protein [Micropepsaceae bacterium]
MKKVVVTGMGCVSGLGANVASNWAAMIEGKSAIQPVHKYCEGTEDFSIDCVAAPVAKNALDELRKTFPEKQIASVDIFANLGAAATLEALKDAKLFGDRERLAGAGIIYGSASGGNVTVEAAFQRILHARLPNIHPMSIPRYMNSASVSYLSMLLGVRGHCLAVSSACASSAHAISEAMYYIRSGRGSIVITGGSDSSLTLASLLGWKALQAMAPDACRPFSIDRKGMVIGEGAATLILEEEEHAKRRGAPIYAEVMGAGSTADARHITQPDSENAAATIRAAHRDAGIGDDQPMLISSHGTGTKLNDKSESIALRLAYGDTLAKHRVIATKSSHGHMLGATGAMEFLVALVALEKRLAPPIVGYLGPDPECDLPLVLKPEPIDCDITVSTSFAFGGLNCVLIGRRY